MIAVALALTGLLGAAGLPPGSAAGLGSSPVSPLGSGPPVVNATPALGLEGSLENVSGYGFANSSGLTITFGPDTIPTCLSQPTTVETNATGTFYCAFQVPNVPGPGIYAINVTDGTNVGTVNYTVEAPTVSIVPATGPVGATVNVSGAGFPAVAAVDLTFGSVPETTCSAGIGLTANATGVFSCEFSVPYLPAGAQTVGASSGAFANTTEFTILPSLTLTPDSGPQGTSVDANGTGFSAVSAIQVTWAPGDVLVCSTTSGSVGSFDCPFPAPSGTAGGHTVTATDGDSHSASASFSIGTGLTLTPDQGPVGTVVDAVAFGLAASVSVRVSWGSPAILLCTTSSDPDGNASCSFPFPYAPAGPTVLNLTDSLGHTATATFSVEPALALNVTAGPVGTPLLASVTGFDPNANVVVAWNGSVSLCSVLANSTGAGSCDATVPLAPGGPHALGASEASETAAADFTVQPLATVSPDSGLVGQPVTISGTGLWAASEYTDCFQTTSGPCSSGATFTTDSNGVVPSGTVFDVPAVAPGPYYVDLTSETPVNASAPFTVTLASVLLSPEQGEVGSTIGLNGSGYVDGATYAYCFEAELAACPGGAATFSATAGGLIPSGVSLGVPPTPAGTYSVAVAFGFSLVAYASFSVQPSLSLSPPSGPVGTSVLASGAGFDAGAAVQVVDSAGTFLCGATSTGLGSFSCPLTVPTVPGGGLVLMAEEGPFAPTANFTVNASAALAPLRGTSGSTVSLTGDGFAASAAFSLDWNATTSVCSGTTANDGTLTCSFTVPEAPGGTYSLTVVEPPRSVSVDFTLLPSITVSPAAGVTGELVTLAGTGLGAFADYEVCLQASEAACPVGTSFLSTVSGSVPNGTQLVVPIVGPGDYYVDVSQNASFVAATPFTVTLALLTLTPTSGPVGTVIALAGEGFAANTSYAYCFESATGLAACPSSSATFTSTAVGGVPTGVTLTAPAAPNGTYSVAVSSDGEFTTLADFSVVASASLAPGGAAPGATVTVTGTGFEAAIGFTVLWGGSTVLCEGTSTALGNISCTFVVPSVAPGSYPVTFTGVRAPPSLVLTVLPGPSGGSSGSGGELWLLVGVGIAVVAGVLVGLLVLRRRRAPVAPEPGPPDASTGVAPGGNAASDAPTAGAAEGPSAIEPSPPTAAFGHPSAPLPSALTAEVALEAPPRYDELMDLLQDLEKDIAQRRSKTSPTPPDPSADPSDATESKPSE